MARDHVHLLFAERSCQSVSGIVRWLKGISSRMLLRDFAPLRKQFWGRHLWARSCFAVSSGTITDALIKQCIAPQEGEPVQDDSRFRIDYGPKLPPSSR